MVTDQDVELELRELFEFFLDREPSDNEIVELESARKSGRRAAVEHLFDHPNYRFKNSYYPDNYVVPNEINHPVTAKYGAGHIRIAYQYLLNREPTGEELNTALTSCHSTKDLRELLFKSNKFIQRRYKRFRFSADRIGSPQEEKYHAILSDIASECEVVLDRLVDFIRYVSDRSWKADVLAEKRLKLKRLATLTTKNAAIIVKKSYNGELDRFLSNDNWKVRTFKSSQEFFNSDFSKVADIVVINNNFLPTAELETRWRIYLKGADAPLGVIWSYDNHHSFANTIRTLSIFDVVIPAHANYTDYLMVAPVLLLSATPCGLAQWTPEMVMEGHRHFESIERSNSLDGGYNLYFNRNAYRSKKIEMLRRGLSNSRVRGVIFNQQNYWKNDDLANLKDWMSHKVSIAMSINNDVPIRIFDALAAGQIPLVPGWLGAFDAIVPPALQQSLPIVKYHDYSVEEVGRAHQKALELFDKDGAEGIVRRRDYCLNAHTLNHRYAEILTKIENLIAIDS